MGQEKRVEYSQIRKRNISEDIARAIPEEFIPDNKRLGKVLGTLFLLSVLIGFIQIGFGTENEQGIKTSALDNILQGNINQSIKIGFPLTFIEFNLSDPEKQPLRLNNLLLTIILFVLLAYLIEVVYKFIKQKTKKVFEEDNQKRPKLYEIKQKSYAEKLTEKFAKKS